VQPVILEATRPAVQVSEAAYLFGDPAMRRCAAALLIQEGVEVERLDAAAAPVFIPGRPEHLETYTTLVYLATD